MNNSKSNKVLLTIIGALLFLHPLGAQTNVAPVSLQQFLNNMQSNYELLKSQGSLVQARQAEKTAVTYKRLPHFNTMFQAAVSSNNNLQGTYQSYGMIPSITGGTRAKSDLNAISGDVAFAGLNWEAVNFGEYKAREDVAKLNLLVQSNEFASTRYDLNGIASAYYLELIRQFELQNIEQDNVTRLQQLKVSIDAMVNSGLRPGVDSMVAGAELSRSKVGMYQAQKNLAQIRVQLSTLTGLSANVLMPDTNDETKLLKDGVAYVFTSVIDTVHHPYINLYSSLYDLGRSKFKLENKSYYPRIWFDANGWVKGSSVSYNDQYNSNLLDGYAPGRFNYFVGLTLTYDIMNIVHKRLNASVARFEADAAYHQLQNEKAALNDEVQRALIEKDFQTNKLFETGNQLESASSAYSQQLGLYKSGLSSVIELNTALSYYITAQKDYLDARVGLMKSVLNYSLVTNSFNTLVQTLKL